jgi:hypothetical protein
MLSGVVMTDEVAERSDLMNHIHGQCLIGYRNTPDHMLNHSCHFVIHHQLSPIKSHSHVEHAQAINEIGTCQCGQEGCQGLLMTRLGVRDFTVCLRTRDPTRKGVQASELGHGSVDHGQLRASNRGCGQPEIHAGR